MERFVHNITVRVILKKEAEVESFLTFFGEMLPVDHEKCRIDLRNEIIRGLEDTPLHVLTMKLRRNRYVELLLHTLFSKFGVEIREKLRVGGPKMMDEKGAFFIRLDRQSLLGDQRSYILTNSGDCVHFKIRLAAFPNNPDNLLLSLQNVLFRYGNIGPATS